MDLWIGPQILLLYVLKRTVSSMFWLEIPVTNPLDICFALALLGELVPGQCPSVIPSRAIHQAERLARTVAGYWLR
jgi:hypothetical protein